MSVEIVNTFLTNKLGRGIFALPMAIDEIQSEDVEDNFPVSGFLISM